MCLFIRLVHLSLRIAEKYGRRHNPKDHGQHLHRHENPESHMYNSRQLYVSNPGQALASIISISLPTRISGYYLKVQHNQFLSYPLYLLYSFIHSFHF
jgi:hypothetical protein